MLFLFTASTHWSSSSSSYPSSSCVKNVQSNWFRHLCSHIHVHLERFWKHLYSSRRPNLKLFRKQVLCVSCFFHLFQAFRWFQAGEGWSVKTIVIAQPTWLNTTWTQILFQHFSMNLARFRSGIHTLCNLQTWISTHTFWGCFVLWSCSTHGKDDDTFHAQEQTNQQERVVSFGRLNHLSLCTGVVCVHGCRYVCVLHMRSRHWS